MRSQYTETDRGPEAPTLSAARNKERSSPAKQDVFIVEPQSISEILSGPWEFARLPSWGHLPQWLRNRVGANRLVAFKGNDLIAAFGGVPRRVWVLESEEHRDLQEELGLTVSDAPLPGRWVSNRYSFHASEDVNVPTAREILEELLGVDDPEVLLWLTIVGRRGS